MIRRLEVQKNGMVVVHSIEPRLQSWTGAKGLCFRIEWWSNQGWQEFPGEIDDPETARRRVQEQRLRNPTISWRLVAFNDVGEVALPKKWRERWYD